MNGQKDVSITQQRIIDAFICLLKDIGFGRIRVRHILELANVNRSTFYHYYLDKYHLLEYLEDVFFEGMRKIEDENIESVDNITKVEVLNTAPLFLYYYEQRDMLSIFINDEGCSSRFFGRLNKEISKLWADKDLLDRLLVPKHYAISAVLGMSNGLLIAWAKGGFAESPEAFTKIFNQVLAVVPLGIFS